MTADIPSIWREEVWHSFSVHLPIITLLLSSLAAILRMFTSNKVYKLFLDQTVIAMLAIGVFSGWVAIYTGELAYNIEVRKICDPKVLQEHQWWSYATLIVYSIALILIITIKFVTSKFLIKARAILLLLIIALLGLFYTGHLGASLVYQQGAGTYKPSINCSEFIR